MSQVGAQDVAMGVKFCATCTLECTEYLEGVPEWMVAAESDLNDVLFPTPKAGDLTQTAVQAAATLLGASSTSTYLSASSVESVDGASPAASAPRDITFRLLEGDFKVSVCWLWSSTESWFPDMVFLLQCLTFAVAVLNCGLALIGTGLCDGGCCATSFAVCNVSWRRCRDCLEGSLTCPQVNAAVSCPAPCALRIMRAQQERRAHRFSLAVLIELVRIHIYISGGRQ